MPLVDQTESPMPFSLSASTNGVRFFPGHACHVLGGLLLRMRFLITFFRFWPAPPETGFDLMEMSECFSSNPSNRALTAFEPSPPVHQCWIFSVVPPLDPSSSPPSLVVEEVVVSPSPPPVQPARPA